MCGAVDCEQQWLLMSFAVLIIFPSSVAGARQNKFTYIEYWTSVRPPLRARDDLYGRPALCMMEMAGSVFQSLHTASTKDL